MCVERPRWCAQRGPERRSERSKEEQRGQMGPEKKQDKMCSKKAQKARNHPERLRTKKSGQEKLGEA